jgi:aminoglycoside phosphotransferase (APT) family kinase protein
VNPKFWSDLGRPPPDSITPLDGGRGMTATLSLVRWHAPAATAVLKVSTQVGRASHELEFFRSATDIPDIPRFYGGQVLDDQVAILLEDLTHATPGDILVGATAAQARSVAHALGRLHARYWGAPPAGLAPVAPRAISGLPAAVAAFVDLAHASPAQRRAVGDLSDRLPDARARLAAAPATLQHADAHLDNWMFGPEPILIDWQTARVGPGAVDLVRVLLEGVPTDVRRAHHDALVAAWCEPLPAGYDPHLDLQAALVTSLAALIPHQVAVDREALSPRMRRVFDLCAAQALALAEDLLG